jgi:hypothetical protein
MERFRFGALLNKFSHTRAEYGRALVKKTGQKSEIALHVMQWRNMITDQGDVRNGVKIERHYYTPQEANAGKSPPKQNRTPGSYAAISRCEVHDVLSAYYLAGASDKYPADYGS